MYKVVGTQYSKAAEHTKEFKNEYLRKNKNGANVYQGEALLVPEPENPVDENAVAVYIPLIDGDAFKLGYLGKGSEAQKAIKSKVYTTYTRQAFSDAKPGLNDSYAVII